MVSIELQKQIISLYEQKHSMREIADITHLCLTTVSKYIKQGIKDPKSKLTIDMTGWKMSEHGILDSRITVEEYLGKNQWRCLCDCGNEFISAGTMIRKGQTKSCGCLHKERVSQLFSKDLTGQRFGKLIVKNFIGQVNNHGEKLYECLCDCGNTTIVATGKLMSGDTASCGCLVSKGESQIKQWLTSHNISFIPQYSFNDLCLIKPLRFDFYLPSKNMLIEYQGIQHIKTRDDNFGLQQREITDQMKKDYCKEKNILLVEIWYNEDIDKVLNNILINKKP